MDLELLAKIEQAKNETDPKALADMALKSPHWEIRNEAIHNHNLKDEFVFKKILMTEKDDFVAYNAYIRLFFINSDSAVFLNPQDVLKINDEDKLIHIVKHSIYKAPSIVAGERVNMAKVYPYLVNLDKRWVIRWAALSNPNLADEDFIRYVALKDYDLRVRCAAITNPNMRDGELFRILAKTSDKYSIRYDAVEYLTDEEILKEIALNDSSSAVRCNAVRNPNLRDKEFLNSLALNDHDYNVRREAVLRISDNEVLKRVFSNDGHGSVRQFACKRMTDREFLSRIATGRCKWKLRSEAKYRLRELDRTSDHIRKFQEMNTTCDSIYDLGDLDVLIVLKDGTNLTSWDEVEERSEVLYVSENLYNVYDLEGRYMDLTGMKAIVTGRISNKVKSLENLFWGCFLLSDISSLSEWDTSNVINMKGVFMECNNLDDISPLGSWDVSNVMTMKSMFENCFSLGSVTRLFGQNTSNVRDMSHMFDDCHSLEDISALDRWDVSSVESMECMFSWCTYLKDISYLEQWDISNLSNASRMFEGCDYLDSFDSLWDWDFEGIENRQGMFSDCKLDEDFIFKIIDKARRRHLEPITMQRWGLR